MAKTFTLDHVVSKSRSPKPSKRFTPGQPSAETLQFILNYSKALQVIESSTTGSVFLILN